MHLFDTPEGFVFHYEHGKHIQSRRFFLPTKKGRYIVSVSAIFFPLQLHDSLRMPTPSSQFVIPPRFFVIRLWLRRDLTFRFVLPPRFCVCLRLLAPSQPLPRFYPRYSELRYVSFYRLLDSAWTTLFWSGQRSSSFFYLFDSIKALLLLGGSLLLTRS